MAVSLFFILSGLILTYTYAQGENLRGTKRAFWQARFARIYPVYLLGLLLHLPFFLNSYGGTRAGLGALILSPVMAQAWFPQTACVWNCPGWSLSAEAFFYLLFPALLPPVVRAYRRWQWRPAWLLWLLTVLPMFLVLATLPRPWPDESRRVDLLYYGPLFRLPEFMLGMLLGAGFLYGQRIGPQAARHWWRLGLAGTALLIVLGATWGSSVRNVLAVPALAALVWGLAHLRSGWLTTRPMQYLGEISYSLYILHAPVLTLFHLFGRKYGQQLPAAPVFTLYLAVTLGLSALAYQYVERPARAWLRR